MKRASAYWLLICAACGCGRESSAPDTLHPERTSEHFKRIDELGRSCSGNDWAQLVRIAAGSYTWPEQMRLKPSSLDWHDVKCRAVSAFERLQQLAPASPAHGVRRHFAAALNDPSVISALESIVVDKAAWHSLCVTSPEQFVGDLVRLAPVHRLRSTLLVRAPNAVAALDADHAYTASARALRLEDWAAELTPEGFARVLDAISPDYVWRDGAPVPSLEETTEIDAHAAEMLEWLGRLLAGADAFECLSTLRSAISAGELGQRLAQTLGHRSPDVREAALRIFAQAPRPDARPRIERVAESDTVEGVRAAAQLAIASYARARH